MTLPFKGLADRTTPRRRHRPSAALYSTSYDFERLVRRW